MIKFLIKMFMIIIEFKQKLSYLNIIVLFLQLSSGVIYSELLFFSWKDLIVIFFYLFNY